MSQTETSNAKAAQLPGFAPTLSASNDTSAGLSAPPRRRRASSLMAMAQGLPSMEVALDAVIAKATRHEERFALSPLISRRALEETHDAHAQRLVEQTTQFAAQLAQAQAGWEAQQAALRAELDAATHTISSLENELRERTAQHAGLTRALASAEAQLEAQTQLLTSRAESEDEAQAHAVRTLQQQLEASRAELLQARRDLASVERGQQAAAARRAPTQPPVTHAARPATLPGLTQHARVAPPVAPPAAIVAPQTPNVVSTPAPIWHWLAITFLLGVLVVLLGLRVLSPPAARPPVTNAAPQLAPTVTPLAPVPDIEIEIPVAGKAPPAPKPAPVRRAAPVVKPSTSPAKPKPAPAPASGGIIDPF